MARRGLPTALRVFIAITIMLALLGGSVPGLALSAADPEPKAQPDSRTSPASVAPSIVVPPPDGLTLGPAGVTNLAELVERLPYEAASVSAFDIAAQRFLIYFPGAPERVNSLTSGVLATDTVVWIRRSSGGLELLPVTAPPVQTAIADLPVTLPSPIPGGVTAGPAGTDDVQALVDAQMFRVESVAIFDVGTQQYSTFIPGAPVQAVEFSEHFGAASVVWMRRSLHDLTSPVISPSSTPQLARAFIPASTVAATTPPQSPSVGGFAAAPPPNSSLLSAGSSTGSTDLGDVQPKPARAPAPTATPAPTAARGCESVPGRSLSLLDRRIGYAASVTGGADGCLYRVTHAGDSGSGSLREGATSGAAWIIFDGDFEITLSNELLVSPNTTIDGRGRRITIHGAIRIPGNNVIVTNLVIENDRGNEYLDGIAIQGDDPNNIWIDHVSFDITPDELLLFWRRTNDSHAPGKVTVTWSRFGRDGLSSSSTQAGSHAILIGAQGKDGERSSRTRLTLAYNLFETHSRAPSVADGARAHIFNNLYSHWGFYGISVKRNGQVRSENNIFAEDAGSRIRAYRLDEGAELGGEVMHDVGSWFPNDASGTEYRRNAVFGVSYGYTLLDADAALMRDIEAGAGATLR